MNSIFVQYAPKNVYKLLNWAATGMNFSNVAEVRELAFRVMGIKDPNVFLNMSDAFDVIAQNNDGLITQTAVLLIMNGALEGYRGIDQAVSEFLAL